MSTTPPVRRSALAHERAASFSVEPRSEYLRHALEARRAKDSPAPPSPVGARPSPTRTASASVVPSADPWLEQAVSDDDLPRMTPMRRTRRPSDGAHPRLPTQRELQSELDTMKTTMFNVSLQLELLKKQNNELKDSLDAANKRIDELEPLEETNIDLREDNNSLRLHLQDVEEEVVQLRDSNAEILQIQSETVANMEQQNAALEEAADVIYHLEQENEQLKKDKVELEQHAASRQRAADETEQFVAVDGQSRVPVRIHSIDESRPSTSHYGSDYYSQPGSPQVKVKTSKDLLSFSDRAKSLYEMNALGKRSIQDLQKRVSDASLRNQSRQRSPPPEVPPIPEAHNAASREAHPPKPTVQAPQRFHRPVPQPTPLSTPRDLSPRPGTAAPRTPTGPKEGLRGLFRSSTRSTDKPARPPSSYKTPTPSRTASAADKHSPTPVEPHRRTGSRCFAGAAAPSVSSLQSPLTLATESLTSPEPDCNSRERWWKDVVRVIPLSDANATANRKPGVNVGTDVGGSSSSSALPGIEERNFLFNPAEDEDAFMKKAQGFLPRWKT